MLAVRDALCVGPLPAVDPAAFRAVRADFLCRWAPRAVALAGLEAVDERLEAGAAAATLWFADDLHDQVQLVYVLTRLRAGERRLVDLPRARPAALIDLPARPLGEAALAEAHAAWAALRAPEPAALQALAVAGTPELPDLAPALARLLEEYPWSTDGLGRTERAILRAAAAGAREPAALFAAVTAGEPRPWAGDATLWWLADGLRGGRRPLLGPGNRPTAHGEAVLAGGADWVALRGTLDRWIGGVHLGGADPRWRWDPSTARLVG